MGTIYKRSLLLIGLPALFTLGAHATVVVNASVSAGGGGGTCSADAHYSYTTGAFGGTSTPACAWSVSPGGPGATAVQLLAGQAGGSTANESIDFSTGILRASINSAPGYGGTTALATLRDTVTFDNSNALPAMLGIIWKVDGMVALDTASSGSCCFDITYQGVLGGAVNYHFSEDVNNGITANSLQVTGYNSSSTQNPPAGNIGGTVTAFYQLQPGLNQLPFGMDLSMGGGYGLADFSHTLQISLDLPQGVTYTSESGAFLTAPPAPTPEPSTWVPVLAGLAVLAFRKFRRTAA